MDQRKTTRVRDQTGRTGPQSGFGATLRGRGFPRRGAGGAGSEQGGNPTCRGHEGRRDRHTSQECPGPNLDRDRGLLLPAVSDPGVALTFLTCKMHGLDCMVSQVPSTVDTQRVYKIIVEGKVYYYMYCLGAPGWWLSLVSDSWFRLRSRSHSLSLSSTLGSVLTLGFSLSPSLCPSSARLLSNK